MVKASLTGKRPQTTTCLFGNVHALWAFKAIPTPHGVMLLVDGELTACIVHSQYNIENVETGEFIGKCRVYRQTVVMIRSMASHGG